MKIPLSFESYNFRSEQLLTWEVEIRDCKKLAFFRARSFELFNLRTAVRAEPTSPISVLITGFKMFYIWAKSINIWLRYDQNGKSSFNHALVEYGCPNCELFCGLEDWLHLMSDVSVEYNFEEFHAITRYFIISRLIWASTFMRFWLYLSQILMYFAQIWVLF